MWYNYFQSKQVLRNLASSFDRFLRRCVNPYFERIPWIRITSCGAESDWSDNGCFNLFSGWFNCKLCLLIPIWLHKQLFFRHYRFMATGFIMLSLLHFFRTGWCFGELCAIQRLRRVDPNWKLVNYSEKCPLKLFSLFYCLSVPIVEYMIWIQATDFSYCRL